ncbi:MAG TPA: hypothetical protein VHK24_13215 [Steroidobacter sp.]|nr:hypothetical protein [Steroidobacter sp.]
MSNVLMAHWWNEWSAADHSAPLCAGQYDSYEVLATRYTDVNACDGRIFDRSCFVRWRACYPRQNLSSIATGLAQMRDEQRRRLLFTADVITLDRIGISGRHV